MIIIIIIILRAGTNAGRRNAGTAQERKHNTQMADNKRKHLEKKTIRNHF
jgi:hypothetical protein